ncbi:MAG: hypothetical protein RLZ12_793 [Bacillota bacterium]|jgi:dTDP-glucose 4,6-dehydratase
MKTILVTGGAGFIGSHYIRHVLQKQENIKVLNVDKLAYAADLRRLSDIESDKRYTFVHLDLSNKAGVNELFNKYKIDHVMHFAAETHVDRSINNSFAFIEANILGTYYLLEAARPAVKRFIHISTDEVYGTYTEGCAPEETVLAPGNPYSASKASSDLLALSYVNTYKMPIIVTRCTNNYGPAQHQEKFIPHVIASLLGNGKVPIYGDGLQERDWLHVEDHCAAIELLRHKGRVGEVYHIGGEQTRSNLAVAKQIADLLCKSYELLEHVVDRPGHDRRYSLATLKLQKEVGWAPKVPFDEGLKATVEWYKGIITK